MSTIPRDRARRRAAAIAVLATAVLAACRDTPASPLTEPARPATPTHLAQVLTCTVTVADHDMRCTRAAGSGTSATRISDGTGASSTRIVGGQDEFVRLAQGAAYHDAANATLWISVTLQNLLPQPMGTTDGSAADPNGVRVFFHQAPIVSGGSGAVTVVNADGTATFTTAGQRYFQYDGVIAGNAQSPTKIWGFSLPATVTAFTFQAYVQASFPDEVTSFAAQPAHAFAGLMLTAAGNSTCSFRGGVGVYCWGSSFAGPSGAKGTTAVQHAVRVLGPDFTNVYADDPAQRACGTAASGTLYCWGSNQFGELGDGTTTPRAVPTAIVMPAGVASFTSVGLGASHTCGAGSDGLLYCWGRGASGALGNGSPADHDTPTPVLLGGVPLQGGTISAGSEHSCAIGSSGDTYCWGNGQSGQLGDGGSTTRMSPVLASAPGVPPFTKLALGLQHSCALGTDGLAYCWGEGSRMGTGDGAPHVRPTAVTTPAGLTFTSITAGTGHTCVLATTGAAYCWGAGLGRLGDGATSNLALLPVAVAMPPGVNFTSISAGYDHTCAMGSNGIPYCFGNDFYGQVAEGSDTLRLSPVPFSLPAGVSAATITSGRLFTCVRASTGPTYCAGINRSGELGVGTRTGTVTPTPVLAAGTASITALTSGVEHSCGLLSGVAACWGGNVDGELGDGTGATKYFPSPVTLPPGITSFSSMVAGDYHTCAIGAQDGRAYCWGWNYYGQLGDGTTTDRSVPTIVTLPAGVTSFTSLAAGESHTCALANDGNSYCWGRNDSGQLGTGQFDDSAVPVQVALPLFFFTHLTSISGGAAHTCGLGADGHLYCWGADTYGELGDGVALWDGKPVQVQEPAGVTGYSRVTLGRDHSCAIGSDALTYCWGRGLGGMLGNGSPADRDVPTPVSAPPGTSFVRLALGWNHTCAIASTGTRYCWGSNKAGQLGDGTLTDRLVPVAVTAP